MPTDDQVKRLHRFTDEHPGWTIRAPFDPLRESLLPHWQAASPDGQVVICQYELRALLDEMEKLS